MTGELAVLSVSRETKLHKIIEFLGGWPGHVFSLGRCVRCHHHEWDNEVCTAFDPWKWYGDALTFAREARHHGYRFHLESPDLGEDIWFCVVSKGNTILGTARDGSAAVVMTEALCKAIWEANGSSK